MPASSAMHSDGSVAAHASRGSYLSQCRVSAEFMPASDGRESMLSIDSHTLSDVVENFSEVVRLRSEFVTTLLNHIIQQELAVSDLQDELKTRDQTSSGLSNVVKLLFELEGTTVYSHVVRLVLMARNENVFETKMNDDLDQFSLRSQSTYNIFN
ncbi:hypothetical protein PC122_g8932 [Phytophthora cactorum]|nr:hypothetical protein PC122_g8932 [Phytophthora cactorum]